MGTPLHRWLACAIIWAPMNAHAFKSDFNDSHRGVSLGVGTYFNPVAADPVPGLGPVGTSISGSGDIHLLPIKLGFFRDSGHLTFELFARYMINSPHTWLASGSQTGTGNSHFTSVGGGLNIGIGLTSGRFFRMLVALNGEYIAEKVRLTYLDGSTLNLNAKGILMGLGLQSEMWLGDMWVFSLLTAYQYGLKNNWSVASAAPFLGANYSSGVLIKNDGTKSVAQLGGILVEATLKLNFR